ncbi:MAG: hypothetical protein ACON4K_12205 [Akkermansiaceae bacterium]
MSAEDLFYPKGTITAVMTTFGGGGMADSHGSCFGCEAEAQGS